MLPDEPGDTNVGADVPLPSITLFAVSVARLVPPFATGKIPVTPVVSGNPVKFVATPLIGVPSAGAVNVAESIVGLVAKTFDPVPVLATLTKFFDASVATALEAVKLE
jgi:hypothetical protein